MRCLSFREKLLVMPSGLPPLPCTQGTGNVGRSTESNVAQSDLVYAAVRQQIVAGYVKMRCILHLPFGDVSEAFRERIPVPLIAGRSTRDPFAVRGQLGIHSRDDRR